jgi:phosphinothricin acetyltransferase
MTDPVVRPATDDDVPALNAIYNTYIVDSHVSFDVEPWADDDRLAWFRERREAGYPVLVVEDEGEVVGAAWSGPWRDKRAYRLTAESTVVLDKDATGRGVGTLLYRELMQALVAAGFHRVVAIIALPNEASIALHRKAGFVDVGVLDDVGLKGDMWVSTMLLQKHLD